jgi:hypothetical protein
MPDGLARKENDGPRGARSAPAIPEASRAGKLSDDALAMRLRELVRSQAVRSALERSSDTLFAFALRAVEQVISDQSRSSRETINRLWMCWTIRT